MKPVSGKRMIQVLKSRGWELQRIRGSHHIFKRPGLVQTVNVPVHGTKVLKPKTQQSIMKAAGLTDDDL